MCLWFQPSGFCYAACNWSGTVFDVVYVCLKSGYIPELWISISLPLISENSIQVNDAPWLTSGPGYANLSLQDWKNQCRIAKIKYWYSATSKLQSLSLSLSLSVHYQFALLLFAERATVQEQTFYDFHFVLNVHLCWIVCEETTHTHISKETTTNTQRDHFSYISFSLCFMHLYQRVDFH